MNAVDHQQSARTALFIVGSVVLLSFAAFLYVNDKPNRVAAAFTPALEVCSGGSLLGRIEVLKLLERYDLNDIPLATRSEIRRCLR